MKAKWRKKEVKTRVVILGVFVVLLTPIIAGAIDARWEAGSGNYCSSSNWNVPVVPCNQGGQHFDVNIPGGGKTVTFNCTSCPDPNCAVDSLMLGRSVTFKVNQTCVYNILQTAELYGVISSDGGVFNAACPNASFPGTTARVYAQNGARIVIPAPAYSSIGLNSDGAKYTLLSADGEGSELALSSLTEINANFDDGWSGRTTQQIIATNSALIDLSGVTTITPPARKEDTIYLYVKSNGQIDLSSLESASGASPTFTVAGLNR